MKCLSFWLAIRKIHRFSNCLPAEEIKKIYFLQILLWTLTMDVLNFSSFISFFFWIFQIFALLYIVEFFVLTFSGICLEQMQNPRIWFLEMKLLKKSLLRAKTDKFKGFYVWWMFLTYCTHKSFNLQHLT